MDKIKLIRTIHYNPGEDTVPYVGMHSEVSPYDIEKTRRYSSSEDTLDSSLIMDKNGNFIRNTQPDTAFSAVGYADPRYSLYPIVSVNKWYGNNGILLDNSYDIPTESLPSTVQEALQKYNIKDVRSGLINVLHQVYQQENPGKEFSYTKPDDWYTNEDWLPHNYTVDDMYDSGLTKLLVELQGNILDKHKYKRLLKNLRGYTQDWDTGTNMDDMPQIALIETPIDKVLTAKDKMHLDSAEQDSPEEYRVHSYDVKGIWSPNTVDAKLRKYYPNYPNVRLRNAFQDFPEEERAKDALADIIESDPDEIISDERLKDIDKVLNGTRLSSNIVNAVTTRRY